MAFGSHIWRSPHVNPQADLTEEQNKLAGQGLIREFNAKSNEAPTKAPIPPKAPTLPLVPLSTKDLFIKFMKVFMETT